MSKKFVGVTIEEQLVQQIDSWRSKTSRSGLFENLLQRALLAGFQLEGLQVEHENGSRVSKVFVEEDNPRAVTHQARGEAVQGQHFFDALRCGGCIGLKESL